MSRHLRLVRPDAPPEPEDAPPAAPPIVGIDLGTTHSLVAVMGPEGPRLLSRTQGAALLPSAVALDDTGHLLVGTAALDRLVRRPGDGVRWFKRDMGDNDVRAELGPHSLSPIELSALVLRELVDVATEALGQPPKKAVITVPAYFQEPQRAATAEAGRLAGLEVVRLVNEPTAAAMAHGLADADTERTCVVVDLGGGTLDVTVLEIFDGVVEITASGGDGRLGGEDFTDRLTTAAAREAGLDEEAKNTLLYSILREECERAKRRLTDHDSATVTLPSAHSDTWEDEGSLLVSRALFATLCEPLTDRIRRCIVDTLATVRTAPADVDEVLLVGGATRMPAVRELVASVFGTSPRVHLDPDTTVALGAAVQAGLIAQDAAVGDLVVTDVLSHSLGVEVVREGKDRFLGGYFLPVLHRNTTLPTRGVKEVQTLHPKQRALRVRIYQGEHRYVTDNRLLGSLEVGDLPEGDSKDDLQTVVLTFLHDLNGLLKVEARVASTGDAATVVIEQQAGRLTPEERARAEAALARLNVHPRELLPNRMLLEHAHTRHVRLDKSAKALLDPVLLAFEDALERQDADDIQAAAAQLTEALAHPWLTPGPSSPP